MCARLKVDGDKLINVRTGQRYGMGRLEVISLATLRERVTIAAIFYAGNTGNNPGEIFADCTWPLNSKASNPGGLPIQPAGNDRATRYA